MFPLRGGLLLPRCSLPLNIFEPRYLSLIDDVLSGARLIGIIQPRLVQDDVESPSGKAVPLRTIGGVGKLTAYQETDDGRCLVTLTGISRFTVRSEVAQAKPYRVCDVAYEGGTWPAAEKLPNLRYLGVGPEPSQIIKDVPETSELIRLAV